MARTVRDGIGTTQHDAFTYLSRRDAPTSSIHCGQAEHEYLIVDREPGEDCIPRYILQRRASQVKDESHVLLRVTLFDLEDYVPRSEIERFENTWYADHNPDFSSTREWSRAIQKAKLTGAYVFKRSPNVQVIIHQQSQLTAQCIDTTAVDRQNDYPHNVLTANEQQSGHPSPAKSTSPLSPRKHQPWTLGGLSRPDGHDFEVSGIIDHKDVFGVIYYRVGWQGLPASDATWLTEEELAHASWAVDAYHRTLDSENASVDVIESRSTTPREAKVQP